MIVIFMRHGQKTGSGRDARLTPEGRAQAAAAGRWLADQGLRPTLVVHTEATRTRETAAEALRAVGMELAGLPCLTRRGLPSENEAWDAFVSDLGQEHPVDSVVLVVGHHPTDRRVRQRYGLPPLGGRPKPRLTAVLEPGPDGWRCTRHTVVFDGSAAG